MIENSRLPFKRSAAIAAMVVAACVSSTVATSAQAVAATGEAAPSAAAGYYKYEASSRTYPVVRGLYCKTYVRLDNWPSGKIRSTATVSCNRVVSQIFLGAQLRNTKTGAYKVQRYPKCTWSRNCSVYAYLPNSRGLHTWRATASPYAIGTTHLTIPGAKVNGRY